MTPPQEYQAAYAEARYARTRVRKLLRGADSELLKEVDGWERGQVSLLGPSNTWRAYAAQKCFDACSSLQRREIGNAISDWYFAMQKVEAKWRGLRFADSADLPDPDSLIK